MVYQVIGKKRSAGVYEGNGYDNTMLYCVANDPTVEGKLCVAYKCKTAILPSDLKVGDFVVVGLNRYQAVDHIIKTKGE